MKQLGRKLMFLVVTLLILGMTYLYKTRSLTTDNDVFFKKIERNDVIDVDEYKGVTIKDDAKGKVTQQDVEELIDENKNDSDGKWGNIIIWEVQESKGTK